MNLRNCISGQPEAYQRIAPLFSSATWFTIFTCHECMLYLPYHLLRALVSAWSPGFFIVRHVLVFYTMTTNVIACYVWASVYMSTGSFNTTLECCTAIFSFTEHSPSIASKKGNLKSYSCFWLFSYRTSKPRALLPEDTFFPNNVFINHLYLSLLRDRTSTNSVWLNSEWLRKSSIIPRP